VTSRVTHREDLEAPHEPNHRLVKSRTTVLTRQHGRAYTAAQAAFTKVEKFCKRVAEASQQAAEKKEQTVPDAETAPSPEGIPSETPPKDDKPENGPAAPEDTTSGTEGVEHTPAAPEDTTSGNEDVEHTPAAPEDTTSGTEGVEHTPAAPEDKTNGAEGVEDTPPKVEQETPQGADQAKEQDDDLPSCGKCKGPLAFPCWYCVKCEDDLFLCDACEGSDVTPELTRSSGMHTEHHHVIRCQAPKKADEETISTEQRLMSLENRLDNMHTRIESIEQLLRQLAEAAVRPPRTLTNDASVMKHRNGT